MVEKGYIEKGKLLYVPSGVRLLMTSSGKLCDVEEFGTTEKPSNCIIMSSEVKNNLCEILYCGRLWRVKITDVYAVHNKDYRQKRERLC